MPAISVLMPVRDAAPWLATSVASLSRQTFRDFEIVAVNDGSSDDSGERLERLREREPRLRVFHTAPLGLPAALNHALARARSPLIARHDADDLSHRMRLERQRRALAMQPGLAVLGSRVRLFPSSAVGVGMARWIRWNNRLLAHDPIVREMLIDSPVVHGTAMMRRGWLERVGGWSERGWAEDLDLWVRLEEAGARFAKLPETLYAWRQTAGSATRRDPRYSASRFRALKGDAVRRSLLRGAAAMQLVGVGESLRRWVVTLQENGVPVRPIEARRPSPAVLSRLEPPVVLIYMAAESRERWRAALAASDMRELRNFRFVS
jgi:glycosyltransferase involved in cell wall biosynthesis